MITLSPACSISTSWSSAFAEAGINEEIQITDALLSLAKKGKVIAYKFDGKRFDCGRVNGYVDANNFFMSSV